MDTIINRTSFENILLFYLLMILVFLAVFSIRLFDIVRLTRFQKSNKPIPVVILELCNYLAIISICIYAAVYFLSIEPKVIKTYPAEADGFMNYQKPVLIEFNLPVYSSRVIKNQSPEVYGYWRTENYLKILPFSRKFYFFPSQSFAQSRSVMLYLSNIRPILGRKWGGEYLLEFNPPPVPTVLSSSLDRDQNSFPVTDKITFQIRGDMSDSHWQVDINPTHQTKNIITQPDGLIVYLDTALNQGIEYEINLFRLPLLLNLDDMTYYEIKPRQQVASYKVKTAGAPNIYDFSPKEDFLSATDPIRFFFNQAMDADSLMGRIDINPEVNFETIWDSNRKILTIQPEIFIKDQIYRITLKSGLITERGSILEEDLFYNFRTAGPVKVSDHFPQNANSNIGLQEPIKIVFDQEVVKSEAENSFLLSPAVSGKFSWENNTMIFIPDTGFKYKTRYQVGLGPNIGSVNGLPSNRNYSFFFTTQPQRFALKVPLHHQKEQFSCNIASLKMLLEYRGIVLSESQIKDMIGTAGVRGQGNPYQGFTANYGTYWQPIQKAAEKYRQSKLMEKPAIADLLNEVAQGNPVMVWGQNGWSHPHEISWTTGDGQFIYAVNGMHSYIVTGYIGNPESPSHLLINDPWRGETVMEIEDFRRRFSYFATALVVY